jgi:hypothetical protein
MSTISRREAIKKAAILAGATLALPDILKAWGNLSVENTAFAPTADQDALIAEMAETILPTTATPGAKTAGVPAFIKKIVTDCYDDKDRKAFYAGLDSVDAEARRQFGRDFVSCSDTQRTSVLKVIESAYAADKSGKPFWGQFKELTVTGFFTSEIGCTQVLRYEPVPGRYDGAMPYKKGDKAWATN